MALSDCSAGKMVKHIKDRVKTKTRLDFVDK